MECYCVWNCFNGPFLSKILKKIFLGTIKKRSRYYPRNRTNSRSLSPFLQLTTFTCNSHLHHFLFSLFRQIELNERCFPIFFSDSFLTSSFQVEMKKVDSVEGFVQHSLLTRNLNRLQKQLSQIQGFFFTFLFFIILFIIHSFFFLQQKTDTVQPSTQNFSSQSSLLFLFLLSLFFSFFLLQVQPSFSFLIAQRTF